MCRVSAPFTVAEYVKMFTESRAMRGKRVKLLKYHFSCDNYTTTALDMAKAMGYAGFEGANLQYGAFAKHLVSSIGWYDKFNPNRQYCDVSAIVMIYPPDGAEHKYYEWELYPEVVEALNQIGWKN